MTDTEQEYTIKLTMEDAGLIIDLLITDLYGEHNLLIDKIHKQMLEQGGDYRDYYRKCMQELHAGDKRDAGAKKET